MTPNPAMNRTHKQRRFACRLCAGYRKRSEDKRSGALPIMRESHSTASVRILIGSILAILACKDEGADWPRPIVGTPTVATDPTQPCDIPITARAISANLEALHSLLTDTATRSVWGHNLTERDASNDAISAAVMRSQVSCSRQRELGLPLHAADPCVY
jgi:hypothetical protein